MLILTSTSLKTLHKGRITVLLILAQLALCGGCRSDRGALDRDRTIDTTLTVNFTGTTVVAQITLTNRSPQPYPVAKFDVPADGKMYGPLFAITLDGRPIPYMGWMAKRSIGKDSFVWLRPGQSISSRIGLEPSYDLSGAGEYRIRYTSSGIAPPGWTHQPIGFEEATLRLPKRDRTSRRFLRQVKRA